MERWNRRGTECKNVIQQQRTFCVRDFYRNNDSSTLAQQKFCAHYNVRYQNKAAWAALSAIGTIGPDFYEDQKGNAITVNTDGILPCYRTSLIRRFKILMILIKNRHFSKM